MATFKHIPTGKRFLFVHIPRTAGRFFEQNLMKGNDFVWDDDVEIDRQYKSIDGVELAHFHREYYEKYLDVKDIPHITIIRNPIDRFISCTIFLSELYGDLDDLLDDPMMFHSMLQNAPLSQSVNWFRPQIDFLSDKTHIWKFEDGFGDDFADWMSNILQSDFTIQSLKSNFLYNIHGQPILLEYMQPEYKRIQRTEDIEKYVDNFYKLDKSLIVS